MITRKLLIGGELPSAQVAAQEKESCFEIALAIDAKSKVPKRAREKSLATKLTLIFIFLQPPSDDSAARSADGFSGSRRRVPGMNVSEMSLFVPHFLLSTFIL